jgi:acetylornithine deacetylase
MLDADLTARLMREIDNGFDDQVALTQELVRFPSVRGQEHTAQDFMAREMRARGLAVDRWKIELDDIRHLPGFSPVHVNYDNAINVVGAHRPRSAKGRSLILNGHIDVVPVGPLDMWSRPPFDPHVENGWLFGRGGGDMKAGLAGMLAVHDALRRLGLQPAAEVYYQSVIEEECTGNGALACLARGYRAEAALIPEPLDEHLIRAQVGVMWFQVRLRGRPVHVRIAGQGANAIEAAFPLIQALRALAERWNERRHDDAHFAHVDHPINMNVGKIAGGDWASSVPAWCDFDVRIATFPGQDLAAARAEIEACLRDAARQDRFLANNPPEVIWNGFQAEGYVLKDADLAERVLGDAHRSVFDRPLATVSTTGTTDARFFGLYAGIPGLVYGPITEDIHGFDERVDVESIRHTTQAMALFVAEWCGLEAV